MPFCFFKAALVSALCVVAILRSACDAQPFWGQRGHDSYHSHLSDADPRRTALWAAATNNVGSLPWANLNAEPVVSQTGVAYYVKLKDSRTNVSAFDLTTLKELWTTEVLGGKYLEPQLVLSNDGGSIFGIASNGTKDSLLYSLSTARVPGWTVSLPANQSGYHLAVHPAGFLLVSSTTGFTAVNSQGGNTLWAAESPLAGNVTQLKGALGQLTGAQLVILFWTDQDYIGLELRDPTTGVSRWSIISKQLNAPSWSLDQVDAHNVYLSAPTDNHAANTVVYNLTAGYSKTLPSVRLRALATNGDKFAITTSRTDASKAVVARFNSSWDLTWVWNFPDDNSWQLWDQARFAVDGNDMVYVLVPGTLHGIRASDGVYSWRYDAQTSSNSLVSVSLGTAINRSVVFYPENDGYQMLGCCNGNGVCTSNLTCACSLNYYRNDCSKYCLANTTCQGNGVCNSGGNCSCTSTNFWEFTTYGGDNCDEVVGLTLPAGILVGLAFLAVIAFTAYTIWWDKYKSKDNYSPLGSVVSE